MLFSPQDIHKVDLWPLEGTPSSLPLHPYALQENQPLRFLCSPNSAGVSLPPDSSHGFTSCLPCRERVKPFSYFLLPKVTSDHLNVGRIGFTVLSLFDLHLLRQGRASISIPLFLKALSHCPFSFNGFPFLLSHLRVLPTPPGLCPGLSSLHSL